MTTTPTIRHTREGRCELTERQWAAVKALAAGYEWIARRDGIELMLLGLAYMSVNGFLPTRPALALLEPFYQDMAL